MEIPTIPQVTYKIHITDSFAIECCKEMPSEKHQKNMEEAFGWRFEEIISKKVSL